MREGNSPEGKTVGSASCSAHKHDGKSTGHVSFNACSNK